MHKLYLLKWNLFVCTDWLYLEILSFYVCIECDILEKTKSLSISIFNYSSQLLSAPLNVSKLIFFSTSFLNNKRRWFVITRYLYYIWAASYSVSRTLAMLCWHLLAKHITSTQLQVFYYYKLYFHKSHERQQTTEKCHRQTVQTDTDGTSSFITLISWEKTNHVQSLRRISHNNGGQNGTADGGQELWLCFSRHVDS